MASTWFTTLNAIRLAQPDWAEIACYRQPIAKFLGRTYPKIPADLRDDIVQEVLCAMHGSAIARFQPERGRFRDYLRGVIRNQVRKALRDRKALPQAFGSEALAEPDEQPGSMEVVDLQAQFVRAVREFHDGALHDAEARQVLYCLSGRLIDGLSYDQIANKENISRDAVKRRLQAARRGILQALVRGALADRHHELPPRTLAKLAEKVGEALASRRPPGELIEQVADAPARAAAIELVERVRSGLRWFPGLDSPDGQAFVSALTGILDEVP